MQNDKSNIMQKSHPAGDHSKSGHPAGGHPKGEKVTI